MKVQLNSSYACDSQQAAALYAQKRGNPTILLAHRMKILLQLVTTLVTCPRTANATCMHVKYGFCRILPALSSRTPCVAAGTLSWLQTIVRKKYKTFDVGPAFRGLCPHLVAMHLSQAALVLDGWLTV